MQASKITTKDVLMQTVFLAVGIALLVYVIQKFEFDEIVTTLKSAAVFPIVLVVLVSLIGHFLRAWRWQMMMDQTGKTNYWNLLYSLQLAYFVSLAIPRIGEFIKCFTSAETEKKPVSFVFGTVMAERIVDFIVMLLLFGLCILLYNDILIQFWSEVRVGLLEMWQSKKYFVLGFFVLIVVIMLPSINKMTEGEKNEMNLMEGLKSVFNLKNKFNFIAVTIGIWICYFLTSYLLFWSFTETAVLSVGEGFVTMISGTISRMLPIQGGGIGAYHYVIEKLMTSLGVDSNVGISYAILNHGIQFVFQIVVGIISLVLLSRKIDIKNITKLKM
jgi:glycosyltransferase 2 family protein